MQALTPPSHLQNHKQSKECKELFQRFRICLTREKNWFGVKLDDTLDW